jgi:predicted site-specific integrase-resolvase
MTPSKQSDIKPAIRAALYARISTLNHGQDPEVQLGELRDYCQRRGFTITHEYVDKGISGSREKRPALDRLMADCRKRLVDAVVVYRYDRFARSLRQLVNSLEEVRALAIEFISLHGGRKLGLCDSVAALLPRSRACESVTGLRRNRQTHNACRCAIVGQRVSSVACQARSFLRI